MQTRFAAASLAFLSLALSASAWAFDPQKVCGMGAACNAGSEVITYADKSNPFYACPTRELSDYLGTVIGLLSMQTAMGAAPNLSPVTGEPEWTGETESLVKELRDKAHVRSFDQAAAQCRRGRSGIRAVVLNHETGATSIWVQEKNSKRSFWAVASAFSPAR